jgi:hypothetical protein
MDGHQAITLAVNNAVTGIQAAIDEIAAHATANDDDDLNALAARLQTAVSGLSTAATRHGVEVPSDRHCRTGHRHYLRRWRARHCHDERHRARRWLAHSGRPRHVPVRSTGARRSNRRGRDRQRHRDAALRAATTLSLEPTARLRAAVDVPLCGYERPARRHG